MFPYASTLSVAVFLNAPSGLLTPLFSLSVDPIALSFIIGLSSLFSKLDSELDLSFSDSLLCRLITPILHTKQDFFPFIDMF
jgi:hypothetical protein